jgi:hypothetical protein
LELYTFEASSFSPERFTFETMHEHTLGPEGGHAIESHTFEIVDGKVSHDYNIDCEYFVDYDVDIDIIENLQDAINFVEYERKETLRRLADIDRLLDLLKTSEFVSVADYSIYEEEKEEDW